MGQCIVNILRWIYAHVILCNINIQYKTKSLFIILTKFEIRYTLSIKKHKRKVPNKDKKKRRIIIISHVNTNRSNNLK